MYVLTVYTERLWENTPIVIKILKYLLVNASSVTHGREIEKIFMAEGPQMCSKQNVRPHRQSSGLNGSLCSLYSLRS